MGSRTFAAVDVGASGGRVMRGIVDGDGVHLRPVHRFPNGVHERDGHLRWNLTTIFEEVQRGLAIVGDTESIGIDTWAVDYGLLDGKGELLAEPIAYRDDRTTKVIEHVHAVISPSDLYAINGLQFLPFNTVYQVVAEQTDGLWDQASHMVLLPDLLAYWLTGALGTELTNASTTGLLDVRRCDWSTEIVERLGIDSQLLPPVEPPGMVRGVTADGTEVVTVGSHDTASAVMGVPATTEHFAYIASGTWSLVGLELPRPILTEEARASNFTNEIGVDGRTRFLHNTGGLWLLQECMREWGRADVDTLVAAAGSLPPSGARIDVESESFIAPGSMPQRVARAVGSSLSPEETTRCILDSLADAYARTVKTASRIAEHHVEVVHVVGGGSRNTLLCQLTADATGLPVLAGPVEATALGNVLAQARACGAVPETLEEMRSLIASSASLRRYEPT